MSDTEFEIIRRYFSRQKKQRKDVILGIGDDAAVLSVPSGSELVTCIDTLVAGVHFPESTSATAIGHKALAVNLSDLAAMGAEPAWATLSLTLPEYDPEWLEQFSEGMFTLADRYGIELVGGDTTRGPLSVTVQAQGLVPAGHALKRTGSRAGDRIYVTGTLGDAGVALEPGMTSEACQLRLDYPEPRVEAGILLRGFAHAVIDISDGLLADTGHLLEGTDLGADIYIDRLPRSAAFEQAIDKNDERYNGLPLGAGDDYELCFSVPEDQCPAMEQALARAGIGCSCIGFISQAPGIRCLDADNHEIKPSMTGYLHFGGGNGHG